ncbi:hypothetical protein GCM10011416_01080 [Polaribacter pacificus]|uniref:Uracil DNA glycosylase superfamily protein n=1 Tax=Polaribacter pacificus TaxID=1775173 RepID=A0A917MA05_9FLAO|nr:hypothetical protein [Polaribacter pacificus]GGG88589.1 hypothetical protein GCM10011416_01080 [Polaribacter pacificus]
MKFELSEIENIIIKNERLLSHRIGWRFINSSIETVLDNSGIAIITLNPGGNIYEQPVFALNNRKNAYLDENWGDFPKGQDPIQIQIKALFKEINKRWSYNSDYKELIRDSFMAHLIPYRSNSYDDLSNKKETIFLSKYIWSSFINSKFFDFKIIICIGKIQFEILEEILTNETNFEKLDSKLISTGWGNYKSEIITFSNITKKFKLVYLQHLSRFKIFNRKEGEDSVKKLIDYISD